MTRRVLIWVQHLLGFGHFARARVISETLRDAGCHVTLVSGGFTPAPAVPSGIDFVQLPPARSKDELFDELVDEHGQKPAFQWYEARREALLAAFHRVSPDVLITETFPFGRRLVELEVLALLEAAERCVNRPRIICSVRDILQRPRKSARAAAMVERARRYYDAVMVHGDPNLLRLEQSFPEAAHIADHCKYTGYICKEMPAAQGARHEVLVSAGGGAAGETLIATAIEARSISRLRTRQWTIVSGPLADRAASSGEVDFSIVRQLPDFSARLAKAALSISQAGYNTLLETIAASTPAIVVPFETDREQEQITRARVFESLGLVRVLQSCELGPGNLARLAEETANSSVPQHKIDFGGREGTVRVVMEMLAQ